MDLFLYQWICFGINRVVLASIELFWYLCLPRERAAVMLVEVEALEYAAGFGYFRRQLAL
jgi:hypothetical protein